MALLVPNVVLPPDDQDPTPAIAELLRIDPARVEEATLVRRSLDARHGRTRWLGVFRVDVTDGARLAGRAPGVRVWQDKDDHRYGLVDAGPRGRPDWAGDRVVVVGAGPAGLFAARFLAEAGADVLLLERGQPVERRVPAVNGHWRRKLPLDPENNVLFGEGGAGTFSDGKIYTRRRDSDIGYVLRRFVDCGADPAILEEGYAHLGTDKVRAVLPVFREQLADRGVEVRFGARVERLLVHDGRCVGVELAGGEEIRARHVIVGPGHSARDTVRMMVDAGAAAEARPIAIGARIEHPQTVIDQARYGHARGELPPASYRLAYHASEGRKARTFCMCPGGMVVPASSAPDRVVVNGMSFSAQRAFWANAAIIVEVPVEAYGSDDPLAGYAWQDAVESRAFVAGGGDETAPAQRATDLLAGRPSEDLPRTSYPLGIAPADLRQVLPDRILPVMEEALRAFDAKLPGYLCDEAVLVAPETRTTSPVRLLRDRGGQSTTLPGLHPVGEGAGFGGGIVSCALDGIRAARAIVDARL